MDDASDAGDDAKRGSASALELPGASAVQAGAVFFKRTMKMTAADEVRFARGGDIVFVLKSDWCSIVGCFFGLFF